MDQADTPASTSYRKNTPRGTAGPLGAGTMAKSLLGGSLKLPSYKAAPQYAQAAILASISHPALYPIKHSCQY